MDVRNKFNTYMESPPISYWRDLCLQEGTLRHYEKGGDFVSAGTAAGTSTYTPKRPRNDITS